MLYWSWWYKTLGGLFYAGTFDVGAQMLSGPVGTDQGIVVRTAPD